ncbi:MAG: zinc ribbon domain-containing protein [Oculatellaceae cyanobacterium Prado106]|nr:zinc ribbon domain-containing protein [Oculatellaceae cyanobacterium Prado106]
MPLYEFRCQDCGIFDVWRSFIESSNPAYCPDCNAPGRRVYSPPAVLSGSLRLKQTNPEPQLVKRDRELTPPRLQTDSCNRPWMIGH